MHDVVVKRVWTELEPHLNPCGFELVEVEYLQQDGRPTLRVYLDREGGVTLDQCAEASRLIGPLLDEADFVDSAYVLEVSSPGIERPVRKPVDFERFAGEMIRVVTHASVAGRTRFKGAIGELDDGMVQIATDDDSVSIHLDNIKTAKLVR
jgi:ribosome maturation factor RimP